MINKRYKYDGKPILNLNDFQLKNKKIIEDKIKNKKYIFKKISCILCKNKDFELLSEKDRYGLYLPVVICKHCGLIQTNPRMTQQSYNSFYDSEYRGLYCGVKEPTEAFFNSQKTYGKKVYDFISKITKKEITNNFILEIGAGAGGILQYFKEKGNQVFGLDLDSQYIRFGRKKGLNLKIGTIKDLPNFNKKPDIVICCHVLEHILDPINDLKILRKYLNPASLVYIEVPGIKNLLNTYNQDFLRYLQNAHTFHFTLTSLTNCTKKAGFNLIYGNERINSLFNIGKIDNIIINNYKSTINFLKKLEKIRLNPFNLYRIKNKIFAFVLFFFKINKNKAPSFKNIS